MHHVSVQPTFRALLLTICSAGALTRSAAQSVQIEPAALVVSDAARIGLVTVTNPHRTSVLVRVEARYGYPTTDSRGMIRMHYIENPDTVGESAVGFLHFSPHRFRLAPGASKMVRIAVTAPQALQSGEYWARVEFLSGDDDGIDEAMVDSATASARETFWSQMFLPVYFRAGSVATGAFITALSAQLRDDTITVSTSITRRGTAALLGLATLDVTDADGNVLERVSRELAVFHELAPVWRVPLTAELAARASGGSVMLRVSDAYPAQPAPMIVPFAMVQRRVRVDRQR
jgi:P pilus assembly chaperone PapD